MLTRGSAKADAPTVQKGTLVRCDTPWENSLLPRGLLSWSMALQQSPCVPWMQKSADCFTIIRGRTGALSVVKMIESYNTNFERQW